MDHSSERADLTRSNYPNVMRALGPSLQQWLSAISLIAGAFLDFLISLLPCGVEGAAVETAGTFVFSNDKNPLTSRERKCIEEEGKDVEVKAGKALIFSISL
ncbi:hypothetical protein TREES_T100011649 [Tupaia chinensis]|uniref:Uncharacterized protein n=1 Tax=Tupaia chinensis TaxID=246437 RepID=L9L359_TUPCH|nr:hypothetical protein TREES_T100011649 [Tupaia chinensis]